MELSVFPTYLSTNSFITFEVHEMFTPGHPPDHLQNHPPENPPGYTLQVSNTRLSPEPVPDSEPELKNEQDEQNLYKIGPIIPLHVLCSNCTFFCAYWPVLSYLQHTYPDIAKDPIKPEYPPARLCTLSHLFHAKSTCHLCHTLYELAQTNYHRQIFVSDINAQGHEYIWLRPVVWKAGHVTVKEIFGDKELDKWKKSEAGSFSLNASFGKLGYFFLDLRKIAQNG